MKRRADLRHCKIACASSCPSHHQSSDLNGKGSFNGCVCVCVLQFAASVIGSSLARCSPTMRSRTQQTVCSPIPFTTTVASSSSHGTSAHPWQSKEKPQGLHARPGPQTRHTPHEVWKFTCLRPVLRALCSSGSLPSLEEAQFFVLRKDNDGKWWLYQAGPKQSRRD